MSGPSRLKASQINSSVTSPLQWLTLPSTPPTPQPSALHEASRSRACRRQITELPPSRKNLPPNNTRQNLGSKSRWVCQSSPFSYTRVEISPLNFSDRRKFFWEDVVALISYGIIRTSKGGKWCTSPFHCYSEGLRCNFDLIGDSAFNISRGSFCGL